MTRRWASCDDLCVVPGTDRPARAFPNQSDRSRDGIRAVPVGRCGGRSSHPEGAAWRPRNRRRDSRCRVGTRTRHGGPHGAVQRIVRWSAGHDGTPGHERSTGLGGRRDPGVGGPALLPGRLPRVAEPGDRGRRTPGEGDELRHRGQARRRAHGDHRAARRGAPAPRGRARRRQDDAGQDPRPHDRLLGPPRAVHAGPAAQRHHRRQRVQPGRPRLRVPARGDLRQRRGG